MLSCINKPIVNQITKNSGIIASTRKLTTINKIQLTERLYTTSLKSKESSMLKFQQSKKINTAAATATTFQSMDETNQNYDTSFVGMTGAEIIYEMLKLHNVKQIFGYSGSAILTIMDIIFKKNEIKFVVPRHEQGAGHMAEGYARASGNVGVALVTSGPGATNIITPLQDAYSDGIPMVVFSGQVPSTLIGSDAFQEADIVGISRSCTKWNCIVKDINELPRRINEAFYIATSGRPGPVLIDLPKDVTSSVLKKPIDKMKMNIPSIKPLNPETTNPATIHAITRAAKLINKAKRPVVYAGAGLLNHPEGSKILNEFVEKANIPVTTTLQGLGVYDEEKPLALHMLGMHGSAYANLAIQNADVIIALGARFDDRVTGNLNKFAPMAKKAALEKRGGIIHFEIMPKNINKIVKADEAITGDVTENLKTMLPMIEQKKRTEWTSIISRWKKKYPFTYQKSKQGETIKPQEVIEELNRQLHDKKEDTIICTGVGQHQMWTAQYYRWRTPHSIITSGGLGTMGFGLPACIGAKFAKPEKMVIDIDGDSSFSMTLTELATIGQHQLGVKILLLNNSFQGMVKQWQDLFYSARHSGTKMTNPDFITVAKGMGIKGMRCCDKDDLPNKIKEFIETDKPVLLEVCVDQDEHVLPMVPAGNGLDEMELGGRKIDDEDLKL